MVLRYFYEENMVTIPTRWFDSDIGIRFFMQLQYVKKLFDDGR